MSISNDDDNVNLFALQDFDQDDFVHLGDEGQVDLEALLAAADALETQPLTADELKSYITTAQQAFSDNILQREQFWAKPLNYAISDQNLLESVQQLSARLATETQLFQPFTESAGMELLLGLIAHDNLSISTTAIELILSMTSTEHDLIPAPQPPTDSTRDPTFQTPCPHPDLFHHSNPTAPPLSELGPGWIIVIAITRLQGFNAIFNFMLVLDDSLKTHRNIAAKLFHLLELLLENELCFHSLLAAQIIPFLFLRMMYNDTLLQQAKYEQIEEFRQNTPQSLLSQKVYKVNSTIPTAPSSNQTKFQHYIAPLQGMKTNRLYAAELLALIATLDPYCFAQHITSAPFFTHATQSTLPAHPQHKTDITTSKFPSFDLIFHHTILSKEQLLVHPLFNPKFNYLNSLMDIYQHCIEHFSSTSSSSIQTLSEVNEFVNNIASCIKSVVSETRLHSNMAFGNLSTSLLLHSNIIVEKSHHHPRFLFFALQGVRNLIIPGLRSRLLVPTLSILEACSDCDVIRQAPPLGSNDEYCWGIVADDIINQNGLGMIFGYFEKRPTLPPSELEEFQSCLTSTLLHLLLNASSQQSPNNPNPAPLTRLLHKFLQSQNAKIISILKQLTSLFQPLYAGLIAAHPELEQVFGIDIFIGYSTHIPQQSSPNEDDIPAHLSHTAIQGTTKEDEISCVLQHLSVYGILLRSPEFKLISKLATMVTALYTILFVKEMKQRETNQNQNQNNSDSPVMTSFSSIFQQANVHPALIFNIVAESRYYAGNTDFGNQLGVFVDYFAPFVDSFQS